MSPLRWPFAPLSLLSWLLSSFLITACAAASFLWFDQPLTLALASTPDTPWIHTSMEVITRLGVGGTYWALALGLIAYGILRNTEEHHCAAANRAHRVLLRFPPLSPLLWHAGSSLLLALASSGLILRILKVCVGRARPFYWLEHPEVSFHHFINQTPFHSFPSGHTQVIFCAAVILALAWRHHHSSKIVPYLLLSFACLTAISRVYLRSHFPSDVLMGAWLGAICAWLSWHSPFSSALARWTRSKNLL